MNAALRQEIEIFIAGVALSLLIGFFTGHIAGFLIAGMAAYIL
ncbi:MAG TPA: DUF3329 domain-containing protein, partial [Gammaproteobacteria bacterium]|nr:DUF3329 domain-containing protein [Gammaproteobacteria bacterium]